MFHVKHCDGMSLSTLSCPQGCGPQLAEMPSERGASGDFALRFVYAARRYPQCYAQAPRESGLFHVKHLQGGPLGL
jgi:hypothetical protein